MSESTLSSWLSSRPKLNGGGENKGHASQVVDLNSIDLLTCLVSDELLLPHMKRVDGMITDNRKRLLHKLHIGQVLKVGLSSKLHINGFIVFSMIKCFCFMLFVFNYKRPNHKHGKPLLLLGKLRLALFQYYVNATQSHLVSWALFSLQKARKASLQT